MINEDDSQRVMEELLKLATEIRKFEKSRSAPLLADFVSDHSRRLTARSANAISLAIDEYKEREGRAVDCPDYISPLKRIARSNEVADALTALESKLSSYDDHAVRSLLFDLVVNAAYEETDWNQQIRLPADQAKELDERADMLNRCSARITAELDVERKRWRDIRHESVLDRMAGQPVVVMGRFSVKGKTYQGAVELKPTVDMLDILIRSLIPVMRAEAKALRKHGQEGKGLQARRHFVRTLEAILSKYIHPADRRKTGTACNSALAALHNAALNCVGSTAATSDDMRKLRSKVRHEPKCPPKAEKSALSG